MEGIPPARAGTEKVEITFAYDENGVLKVVAKVLSTGITERDRDRRTPLRESCRRQIDAELNALHVQCLSEDERDEAEHGAFVGCYELA